MLNQSLTSTLDRMMTLNRAIDDAFAPVAMGGRNGVSRVWVPAIDVVEKPEAYVIHTELPGVERSQIELDFEQNVLTIRGTKNAQWTGKDAELRVYAAERVSGAFERTVRLPEFVDGEKISAEFTNGLLTVTVPKAQSARARKIEIAATV